MKRIIQFYIIVVIVVSFPFGAADARKMLPNVTYRNLLIHYDERTRKVDIRFEAQLKKRLASDYSLIIVPRFEKEGKEEKKNASASKPLAELPCLAMEGGRARISRLRKVRSKIFHEVVPEPLSYISPAQDIYTYKTSIPYEEWVDGVSLVIYSTMKTYSGITGRSVFHFENKITFKDTGPVEPLSLAIETLVEAPSFVEQVTDLSRPLISGTAPLKEVEQYVEAHGDGSLNIFFEANSSQISLDFMNNRETIGKLLDAVRDVADVNNNRAHVVIVGYSSPEGKAEINQRLAIERAWAVQKYIASHSSLSTSDIITYDAGINWLGLKRFIASDPAIPGQSEAIPILDEPVWDSKTQTGRLGSLMRLKGGETYRYLLRNYFPQLRGAAFIKVFYE
jgi:hypothetical protein